jgi:hypothetical protein
MKRTIFLISLIATSSVATYGQNELDVYKLSRNDLTGTARSVAMGGGFWSSWRRLKRSSH